LGRQAGIEFNFDVIGSSTFDSHRLVLWSQQTSGKGEDVAAVLARFYFQEGRELADHANLRAAAAEAGIVEGVDEFLSSDVMVDEVKAAFNRSKAAGIDSIPVFIFSALNDTVNEVVHGSASPDQFRATLESIAKAAAERSAGTIADGMAAEL
jgi:predicted DsbA family dithiol-disulfide isomerase